jgi:hypothetical protein
MKNSLILKLILQSRGNSEAGYALVIVMIVSAAMMSLMLNYMMFAENASNFLTADVRNVNAFSAANGALADRNERVVRSLLSNPDVLKNNLVLQSSTPFDCSNLVSINTGASSCNSFRPDMGVRNQRPSADNGVTEELVMDQYKGYTAVRDSTTYDDFAKDQVAWTRLSPSDRFPGAIARPYAYTIGSLGIKKDDAGNTRAQSILEANVAVRHIPVFQFDRFSLGDDTIVLGGTAPATIAGRYHTNGNLTIINENTASSTLSGNWTMAGRLNLSVGQTYLALPRGFSLIPNVSPVTYADLTNYRATLRTIETGMPKLIVPSSEILKPKDSSGNLQALYGNADIRITRKRSTVNNPSQAIIDFDLVANQSGTAAQGTSTACTDIEICPLLNVGYLPKV